MQAAAATTVQPAVAITQPAVASVNGSAQQTAQQQPNGKSAAAQELPRWDINDGDAWYKRQQVDLCRHGTSCMHVHVHAAVIMPRTSFTPSKLAVRQTSDLYIWTSAHHCIIHRLIEELHSCLQVALISCHCTGPWQRAQQ